jgi:hypothetical protein
VEDYGVFVANLNAQQNEGKAGTDEDNDWARILCFRSCLRALHLFCERERIKKVALPAYIGCDREGGDWEGAYLPSICEVLIANGTEVHLFADLAVTGLSR